MTKLIVAVAVALVLAFFLLRAPRGGINGAEARRLVKEGAVLLDVRTPAEFASGHLEGAINIPVQELDGRLGEVGDKNKAVIVYCRSGARSARATKTLADAGFTAHDLGPMTAW